MDWKTFLAIIGGASIILGLINTLFNVIPKLANLKAEVFYFFSDSFKFIFLKRKAIKSDIESTVNNVVFKLQGELPSGWLKRANIKWVRNLNRKDQAPENELILRIKPKDGQEENIMEAVNYFFENTLFPEVEHIIPDRKFKSSSLLISRRALTQKSPSYKDIFNKTILERAIPKDDKLIQDFSRLEKMDNLGFFTSAFMREMHAVAKGSLYSDARTRIDNELDKILSHMYSFVKELASEQGQVRDENKWSRTGPVTSYAFLLVARPDSPATQNYINKAIERKIEGVDRLYVLAKKDKESLARQVVNNLKKTGEFEIEDTFSLHKDYRCNDGGFGAVLVATRK